MISVVIPTFNRADYLQEAIGSVMAQNIAPEEIIIVDNGDIPPPEHIMQHSNTRYVRTIFRSGASQARNIGASLASGDYIAFLDDDDLWEPDYISKCLTVIKEQAPDIIVARLDALEDEQVKPWKNARGQISKDCLLEYNPGITGSNFIVRKNIFFELGGYDVRLYVSEDKMLLLEALLRNKKIHVAENIQAIHRKHGPSLSNTMMGSGLIKFLAEYRKHMTLRQRLLTYSRAKLYRYGAKGCKEGPVFSRLERLIFRILSKSKSRQRP